MKKITSIILIVLTALSLASCGAALDDEQTKEVAAPLIEASFNVNEIFFGKGLAHEEIRPLTVTIRSPTTPRSTT